MVVKTNQMNSERIETADVTKIYKLWSDYSSVMTADDADHMLDLWCIKGLEIPQGMPDHSGINQIKNQIKTQLHLHQTKLAVDIEVVRIFGNHAFTFGSFTTIETLFIGEGKVSNHKNGKFLSILGKRTDGSWRILLNCFNYDKPQIK